MSLTTDISRLTCREGREGVREGGKKGEREEGNHQKLSMSVHQDFVLCCLSRYSSGAGLLSVIYSK